MATSFTAACKDEEGVLDCKGALGRGWSRTRGHLQVTEPLRPHICGNRAAMSRCFAVFEPAFEGQAS
jgi:hypothetical protein